MNKKHIWKLVTDQLDEDEEQDAWEEIEDSSQQASEYNDIKKVWSLSAANPQFSEQELDNKFKEFKRRCNMKRVGVNHVKIFFRYAAIIALAAISSYLVVHNKKGAEEDRLFVTQISSGKGSVNSFTLADGSLVWLNARSEIVIHSQSESQVEMELVGEAMFEVVHNDERTFVVKIGELEVKDLGTRFNLRNYPADSEVVATLLEGEIEVQGEAKTFTEKLLPGQQLRYHKLSQAYELESIDVKNIDSWIDGKIEFVDKALKDIAIDIENWYGVTIAFENKEVGEERFTGIIQKGTSVEQVMKILSYSAGIKYSINEKDNEKKIMIK